jgi:hypothetical protein
MHMTFWVVMVFSLGMCEPFSVRANNPANKIDSIRAIKRSHGNELENSNGNSTMPRSKMSFKFLFAF